ncbi:hypothetical protein HMI55_002634, partial [Coelomomyces lativittatus]
MNDEFSIWTRVLVLLVLTTPFILTVVPPKSPPPPKTIIVGNNRSCIKHAYFSISQTPSAYGHVCRNYRGFYLNFLYSPKTPFSLPRLLTLEGLQINETTRFMNSTTIENWKFDVDENMNLKATLKLNKREMIGEDSPVYLSFFGPVRPSTNKNATLLIEFEDKTCLLFYPSYSNNWW